MVISTQTWSQLDDAQRRLALKRPSASQDPAILDSARRIVERVRHEGDKALFEYTQRFDGAAFQATRVDVEEIDAASAQLSKTQMAAIDFAIANVRSFHEQQRPGALSVETVPGVRCERASHALDSVGLYVPAGSAPLPSAAIMLAVPAAVAGCPEVVLCSPPRADGTADPAVLAAASRAGGSAIFKVGGAQAIAAMAYGTKTIPKVLKIFGPGNAYVTAAKAIVSIDPAGAAIDMPAGPSEVLVIADKSASPAFVAADLLSQAEHGADSQVILVTTDTQFAQQVRAELEKQVDELQRADTARAALCNSRILVVEGLATAVEISNRYAPEHLIIQVEEARSLLPEVRNAGSVFVGQWTPESVGDYCSGTNHVLPTYGYASTYSGLGVEQFMRHMTVQEVSREGLLALAPAIYSLSEMEGLDAHAAAVRRRLGTEQ
ncbi:MAG TPA: histidinol dehydrogenase [Woeseiaceae bacterium]|nr:histidinol dehydrogenase [Woeseiaceae bacterium]